MKGNAAIKALPQIRSYTEARITLPKELKFLRAIALLWGRLGTARIYVAIGVALIIVLAAIGLGHIVGVAQQAAPFAERQTVTAPLPSTKANAKEAVATPRSPDQIARIDRPSADASPTVPATGVTPTPVRPTIEENDLGREVEITGIRQTRRRGLRGETFVVATVGLASQSPVEKGDLEIRINFFDVTANSELRPTDAQVTYRWLSPIRDWSDPTPKYLAATYLQWPVRHRWLEKIRYAGVLVQVFGHGQLQDERSEPVGLLSRLRGRELDRSTQESDAAPSSGPALASPPISKESSPKRSTTPPPTENKNDSGSNLPYGKPVQGKAGFVSSPYDPRFIIDVRGFPPGTLVNDPNTNKPFRIP